MLRDIGPLLGEEGHAPAPLPPGGAHVVGYPFLSIGGARLCWDSAANVLVIVGKALQMWCAWKTLNLSGSSKPFPIE